MLLTPAEIAIRIERLTHAELCRMEQQVGLRPTCKCMYCTFMWKVRVNRFLRQVEASRN